MVFSQTSHKTRSLLKVVEIDRLKPNKSQQVNGTAGGVITDENPEIMPSPLPTTSFSEVRMDPAAEYLKPEPLFENTMFPQPDYEFFQDLDWSSAQGRDEPAQTTDMAIKKTEERANTFDTTNTQFSPSGWDATSPLAYTSLYGTTTPYDSLSPTAVDGFSKFDEFLYSSEFNKPASEQILNISDLPVVIDEGTGGCGVKNIWPVNNFAWPYTNTPQYSKHSNTTQNMPFIALEDSLNQDDMKFMPVTPREVENNNVMLSEYPPDHRFKGEVFQEIGLRTQSLGLSLDVAAARGSQGPNISTPDVVNCVVQMERQETPLLDEKHIAEWPSGFDFDSNDTYTKPKVLSPVVTRPPSPVYESQAESDTDDLPRRRATKRRHPSEDSDETYTPPTTTRREKDKKRKKPDSKIKAIMDVLEKTKTRRGRPPNRRTSIISTGSVDDNASNVSTQEMKYRELRDKNNEASKRSRMNRKLKELQMEQQADELEEQNKKLRVRANILEEMTVKLKNALMAAMTQK